MLSYISDMKYYGSGGTATKEKYSAGFRVLSVDASRRGQGIDTLLISECILKAKNQKLQQIFIHSTKSMHIAWKMYEKIGFKRAKDLDFFRGELPVFGFKLSL